MVIAAISAWTIGSPGQIMVKALEQAAQKGHTVYVYAQKKNGYDTSWIPNYHRISSELGLKIHIRLATDTGLHGLFSAFSTMKLIWELEKIHPDIIHLHNLHGWFLNYPLFFSWLKKSKIRVIWTLHDCWAFTGHCPHFVAEKCNKWVDGCYDCPRYKEYPASKVDQSKLMWKLKRKWFTGIPELTIVTPSRWLKEMAKRSYLKEYPIRVIYNGIDLNIFKPLGDGFRRKYRLENKFIILGVSFAWGYKKGLDVFCKLREKLDENFAIVLVGFDDKEGAAIPEGIITISKTDNQKALAEIYSAADVFVNPTREEVLGLVNIEALACGTPVITFPTGGSPEVVDATCGIVTEETTSESMLKAILQMQKNKNQYTEEACRQRAKKFDQNACYDSYAALYEETVKNA